MAPSPKVALSVLFQAIRSSHLRRNLKAFILRCLLLWPRILRKLRKAWLCYFQPSSSGEKNTKGDSDTRRPSSTGELWRRDECVVVCASQDFGRSRAPVGEPSGHLMSGPRGAEPPIPMEAMTQRNPSVHTFSSHASSPQGSTWLSVPPSPRGSPHASASSLREGRALGHSERSISRSRTPLSRTHPKVAGRHFTGSSSRSRSRPSSPSPFPFLRHSPRPNTPTRSDIDILTRPATTQHSQDSEGSPSIISIEIEKPSRPGTPEKDVRSVNDSEFSPPQEPQLPFSTLHGSTQSLPTHRRLPSTEFANPPTDSKGHSPSGHGTHIGAQQSGEGIRPENPTTSQSTQASPWPPIRFPEPFIPHAPLQASTMHVGIPFQPDVHTVRPMHSDLVSRYAKNGDVPRIDSEFELRAMKVDLPHSYKFPDSGDWTPITHPEGALYFYHERMRIFTDVYMYNPWLREEVWKSAVSLRKKLAELESRGNLFPTGNYDLVIDIVETKDKNFIRQYYFVDHNNRTLFWLEDYDMRGLLFETLGVREPGHIKLLLESLYWGHWSLYPAGYDGREFPESAFNELLEILLSSSIDSLTCKVSTAPYSVADMQTIRDIIKEAKDLGHDNPHAISLSARMLSICVRWRFVHFHGQKTSRQSRYKSIYEDSGRKRSKVFRLLSLILFFTPDVHLRELKKVWADDLIIEEIWRDFVKKLVSEWEEFVLYSTVMLTANVAFIAIPGVVPSPDSNGYVKASPGQIASTMSLVFSIGSIIAGLLLIRRNRTMETKDPREACDYLDSMTRTWRDFDLEPLAVIFSLTYALLMWSVCVFFVALLLFSFEKTTTHIRASVGAASGFVTILVICCIINSWESDDGDSERDEIIDIISEEGSQTTAT